jgi:hypothetical protein
MLGGARVRLRYGEFLHQRRNPAQGCASGTPVDEQQDCSPRLQHKSDAMMSIAKPLRALVVSGSVLLFAGVVLYVRGDFHVGTVSKGDNEVAFGSFSESAGPAIGEQTMDDVRELLTKEKRLRQEVDSLVRRLARLEDDFRRLQQRSTANPQADTSFDPYSATSDLELRERAREALQDLMGELPAATVLPSALALDQRAPDEIFFDERTQSADDASDSALLQSTLSDALYRAEIPSVTLEEVTCRNSACEIVVQMQEDGAERSPSMELEFMSAIARAIGQRGEIVHAEDEFGRAVYYATRR